MEKLTRNTIEIMKILKVEIRNRYEDDGPLQISVKKGKQDDTA